MILKPIIWTVFRVVSMFSSLIRWEYAATQNGGIPKIQILTNILYYLYFMNADILVFHEKLENIKT